MPQVTNARVVRGRRVSLEGVFSSRRTTQRATAAILLLGAAGLTTACAIDVELPEKAQPAAKLSAATPEASKKIKPKPRDPALVVAVIDRFHRAVDKGDGKRACAQLTKTLQGVYATNPGAGDCAGGIEYTHEQLDGAKMAGMELAASDVKVKGREAVVSHVLIAKRNGTKASATDSYNLVKQGGQWKIDYVG